MLSINGYAKFRGQRRLLEMRDAETWASALGFIAHIINECDIIVVRDTSLGEYGRIVLRFEKEGF